MEEKGIRLNKYIAQCGVCSRRDADKLISEGRVSVNWHVATQGETVSAYDKVYLNGKLIKPEAVKQVYAYYKPIGVTCTEKDAHAEKIINDCVKLPVRVTYAGRLDKESEGLMLLTNDGDLINAVMRARNVHEKEYIVKVNKEITDNFLLSMTAGVYIKELKVKTRECRVEKIGKYTFRIILTQGLNRQIRYMCKACGYKVESLKRVRIMNILLGDLKENETRLITGEELDILYNALKEK